MRLESFIVLLMCISSVPLTAQMRFEQIESRGQSLLVSYEPVTLFNSDSAKLQLDIHYRIAQNFFIFVRNESATQKTEYVAHGELVVELLDEQKVSVARQIRQLPLSRSALPRETDRPQSLQGVLSFSVPPGTYALVFSVDDHESGRSFIERNKKITIIDPKISSFEVSQFMLIQFPALHEASQLFVPMNRGGNVLFGDAGGFLVEIFQPATSETLSVHWKLHGQLDGFGERTLKLEGDGFTPLSGLLRLMPQDQGVLYGLTPNGDSCKTLFVPLPLEKIEPGMFTLEVLYRLGTKTKLVQHQFRIVWPARPFSLADPDLAVDALRHIASDSEIEEMQSGSLARRSESFYRFWKAKSQDTTNAYNQAMAEYYYRVDDAMRKFSTARENDGYKTDRGRIYILYGPPEKSERLLQPNTSPTEIWTYERLHRRFVFIDTNKNGNYLLSQAENI